MSDLGVSVGSLIVGVVVTVWVSRYYFKRTIDKSLIPYVQFCSSLFDGVDASVRESLKIAYKGTPVEEILEIQFLIANTGVRPIRDVISPLTLAIPNDCSLLDASILHVAPEGRAVKIVLSEGSVAFCFPLLNAGDFFITKLLLQGKAKPKDFKFSITVDDLPPTLNVVPLPEDLIEYKRDRKFIPEPLWTGVIFIIFGSAFAGLIYAQWPTLRMCWSTGLVSTFPDNWLFIVSSVIASVPTLFLLVFAPMMIIGSFTDFSFPKRKRFLIPEDFHRRRFNFNRNSPIIEISRDDF